MSDTETQRVTCPSCDKGYRWDAKLIGKTVSCKGCGAHFEVPDRPGIAGRHLNPVVANDGTYDLNLDEGQRHPDAPEPIAVPANDGKCPSCNNKIKETAVICLNCGFNLKAGQKIQTTILDEPDTPATTQPRLPQTSAAALSTRRSRVNQDALADEAARRHRFLDYKLPAILLVIGVGITLLNLIFTPFSPTTLTAFNGTNWSRSEIFLIESIRVTSYVFLNTVLLFVGLLILVRLFGAAFGELLSVILKVAAIVLITKGATTSVFHVFDVMTGGYGGYAIWFNWAIYLGLMCGLCVKLLDLDVTELRLLIVFIVVGRVMADYGLIALLLMVF